MVTLLEVRISEAEEQLVQLKLSNKKKSQIQSISMGLYTYRFSAEVVVQAFHCVGSKHANIQTVLET